MRRSEFITLLGGGWRRGRCSAGAAGETADHRLQVKLAPAPQLKRTQSRLRGSVRRS